MPPALLADAVLVFHLLFIGFVVFGAFLAWRWPWLVWLHAPVLAWGVWIEASGGLCPLTPLEQSLRQAANETGYSGGFIEHYLVRLIYPEGLTDAIRWGIVVFVTVVNSIGYEGLRRRRRRRTDRG